MENQQPDVAAEGLKKERKIAKKELSKERVFMGAERLQLAWVRISTTLAALGFTIFKIFEGMMKEGKHLIFGEIGGREIGLFMLSGGFIGLLLATIQHHRRVTKMKNFYGSVPFPLSLVVSYLMLILSSFLLISTFFRLAS